MNNLDKQYINLIAQILNFGYDKTDRTGVGTKSIFGYRIEHDMKEGFPLLTTKNMAWKQIVSELIWFLRGDTNIKWLLEHNNRIWVGDAYKYYINQTNEYKGKWPDTEQEFIDEILNNQAFANKWGEMGPIYGYQWRKSGKNVWPTAYDSVSLKQFPHANGIDQISNLIMDIKTNPNSRRLMVNSWIPTQLHEMRLPPCHYGFQCYVRPLTYRERYDIWYGNNYETGFEYHPDSADPIDFKNDRWETTPTQGLSLMWNQRSVDVPLGLPFNIASYGLLLTMLAKECGMMPDKLIGNLGDCHIYNNQIDGAKKQLKRIGWSLPHIHIPTVDDFWDYTKEENLDDLYESIRNYRSDGKIDYPLNN